jgi:hypothetical protein
MFTLHETRLFFQWATPVILAFGTFAWYRSGRLWKFYYNMLDDSTKQMVEASIHFDGWDEIAKKHTIALGTDYFGALLQIEIEYLRYKVEESRWEFWSADGSSGSHTEVDENLNRTRAEISQRVHDKKKFAHTLMREIFFKEVRIGGLGLLCGSIKHWATHKPPAGAENTRTEIPVTGLTERQVSKKAEQQ